MANDEMNDKRLEMLIRLASQRLGMSEGDLVRQMQSGDVGGLGAHMNPDQQRQFQAMIQTPELAKQLIDSPSAQAILKQLMGGN